MALDVTMKQRIDLFRDLFVNREDIYPVQYCPTPGESRYTVKQEPLTDDVIAKHLQGRQTIGLYSSPQSTTKWAVVDFDSPDKAPVLDAVRKAEAHGLKAYVEDSGRKGWHVWVFFQGPVPNSIARRLGQSLAPAGVEVFPKQDSLGNGPGSLIKAPLGVHRVTGRRCWFVDELFRPVRDQRGLLRDVQRFLPVVVPEHRDPIPRQATVHETPNLAKPCVMNAIRDGTPEGARKTTGLLIASECRRLGNCRDEALGVLRAWNLRNRPQLQEAELHDILKSTYSKVYEFGCAEDGVIRKQLQLCIGTEQCGYYREFCKLQPVPIGDAAVLGRKMVTPTHQSDTHTS